MLQVTLPKREEAKPKQIQINVGTVNRKQAPTRGTVQRGRSPLRTFAARGEREHGEE